jgi:hypothetical protein
MPPVVIPRRCRLSTAFASPSSPVVLHKEFEFQVHIRRAFDSFERGITKSRSISAVRSVFRCVFVTSPSHLDSLSPISIPRDLPAHRCWTTCRKERREEKKYDMIKSSAIGSFPSRPDTPTPNPEPLKRNEDCDQSRTPKGQGTSAKQQEDHHHSPEY